MTVLKPAQVPGRLPEGVPADAVRPARPGADRPADRRADGRDRVRHRHLRAAAGLQAARPPGPRSRRRSTCSTAAERPLIVAGGGIINADAADLLVELAELIGRARHPDPDGLGHDPRRPPADGRHGRPADLAPLRQRDDARSPTSCSASATAGPTGTPAASTPTRAGRTFVHVDIEPTQIGRVFAPDYGIVSDAGAALDAVRRGGPGAQAAGPLPDSRAWVEQCRERKRTHAAQDALRQRADQAAARLRGDEQGVRPDTRYVSHDRAVADRRPRRSCTSTGRGTGSTPARPARWAGRCPAALGVCDGRPATRTVVALSGDYDFQFMIEELAVGAQFNIPYIHVVVNNAYLGLIRQSQRGFEMDYCVQLSFDNINAPELNGYGVDHVKVAEGLGCKAMRVVRAGRDPARRWRQAKKLMVEHRVPVVVEVILERVTNISMGTEIDNVVEFEELAASRERRPDRHRAARLRLARRAVVTARRHRPRQVQGVADRAAGRRPRSPPGSALGVPDVEAVVVPVADGGDGTVDAALSAGSTRVPVAGRPAPPGEPVDTAYARPRRRSRSSSWPTSPVWAGCPAAGCAPLTATSAGLGRADRGGPGRRVPHDRARHRRQRQHRRRRRHAGRARRAAARRATATTLGPGGGALSRPGPGRPDRAASGACAGRGRVVVACDVDNPLLGPTGAAAVYGPQKGASPGRRGAARRRVWRTGPDLVDRRSTGARTPRTTREPVPPAASASPPGRAGRPASRRAST